MSKQLDKIYDPKAVEARLYDFWESNGFFHMDPDPDKTPYTIVMPPPNITGQLHMGHALDNTLQDILIRFRRMQGYCALWLPGTDHASIATEAKIVAAMAQEGLTKEQIGRDEFLKRAWEWKKTYGDRITTQLRKLGSSCDWQRERFTMDEGCSKAVKEVFARLYEKGLIYRGERIINWCPHCKTSISDAEVEYSEQEGFFWHLRYPLADGSGFIEVATTRPETMMGDTAVAVHPDDERYKHLVGKTLILPLMNREIPIVADAYVDPAFGTGAVKITPAHDPNDFEVGQRHGLPVINIFDETATVNENGGKYCGMERYEARKAVVADLEAGGYLLRVEPHTHNVGECYRCHTTVEPWVSAQWFVKMAPLAKPAIEAVRSGQTKFIPERFEKTYFNWMENIRDWCISRQLWWGHRLPVWYCDDCGETVVSKEDTVTTCPKCGGHHLTQDPDTLDTWFSSALWPFSTLGWPENTEDLRCFYPTNTLVTGYDIIFFWVARMIFSGIEHMGQPPFNTVLIHGLVRDAQGRKMSKSLGNGIDPLQEIDKYGADALRFTLATGNSPGNDMRYTPEKAEASRNFANKIWNAARFVLMNLDEAEPAPHLPQTLALEDKWILTRLNDVVKEVTENLEKFELGIAVAKLYDFIWDVVCDWYIELCKARLNGDDPAAKADARAMLVYVMDRLLKLLHPFMPFITEEIWQTLPHEGASIMRAPWPVYDPALNFAAEAAEFERIIEAVRAVRNRRAEMNVAPSKKAALYVATRHAATFQTGAPFFARLASASHVTVGESFDLPGAVSIVTADATMYIPMDELVDLAAERARLQKEKEQTEKVLAGVMAKLNNEAFTSKAPKPIVDNQRQAAEKLNAKLRLIQESLAALQ